MESSLVICASCHWTFTASRAITCYYLLSPKHCMFSVSSKISPMRNGPVKVGSLPQWKWQISLWTRLYGKQCPKWWNMWEVPTTKVSPLKDWLWSHMPVWHSLISSMESTVATRHLSLFQWYMSLLCYLSREALGRLTDLMPASAWLCIFIGFLNTIYPASVTYFIIIFHCI